MVNDTEPRTLTPYDLVASESDSGYVAGEEGEIKAYEGRFNNRSNGPTDPGRKLGYERFNNWSNWGNGPTNPARAEKGLEKALS